MKKPGKAVYGFCSYLRFSLEATTAANAREYLTCAHGYKNAMRDAGLFSPVQVKRAHQLVKAVQEHNTARFGGI